MSNSDYKSIPKIIEGLKANSEHLESGKMPLSELENMLSEARELYERITVLRYKAIEEFTGNMPEKEEEIKEEGVKVGGIKLNFMVNAPEVDENQTSLIDAIEEEEVKSEDEVEPTKEVKQEEEVKVSEDLFGQLEIKPSLNESLASTEDSLGDKSLGDKLKMKPIEDLVKAIGINQKFLFMNDLFEGENDLYTHAIENLNSLRSFEEAENMLKELKKKYGWEEEDKTVEAFTLLIQRRFL